MNQWIRQIVVFAIFAAVFEAALPQAAVKKYVRLILGTFLILIVLEPLIGQQWEMNLPTVPESMQQADAVPVLEQINEQYDYYVAEALAQSVEGEGVQIHHVHCVLSDSGVLQSVTVYCGPEKEEEEDRWVVLRLDDAGEAESRKAAQLKERFSKMLQTQVLVEWRQ